MPRWLHDAAVMLLKNDKIKAELGLDFVPLEQTLRAQCDALQQAGLLQL